MKKIFLILLLCCGLVTACKDDSEVRVMPELSCDTSTITLDRTAGSAATLLLRSTEGAIKAIYDADWLQVDVNSRRAIFTTLSDNDAETMRIAQVQIVSGSYSKSVTIRQSGKEVVVDNTLHVGDKTDDGLGLIYWVDPADNTIGKAITLARNGGYAFEVTPVSHSAFSVVNGAANSALFTTGDSSDAVLYCKAQGNGNWYLPARDELWDIFDIYNGVSRLSTAFVSAVPNSLTDAEKTARAAFDKRLTDAGGVAMNTADGAGNGDSYWSSTENTAGDKAYWVRFGKSGADVGAKTSTSRFVRCVRTIGNYTYPDEPATLSASAATVSLESAASSVANILLTSNKTQFSVTLGDTSWLAYSLSGLTLTLTAKTANTTGSVRSTTATVVAGSGTSTAQVVITVSQAVSAQTEFKVGDVVADAGSVKGGMVFWVNPDNKTEAKIISLDRASYKWSTATTPAKSGATLVNNDGAANTIALAALSNVAEMPAVGFCQGKGTGWYWPAKDDFDLLFTQYNGILDGATADVPANITDAEKAARAAFDALMTAAGGTLLNTADATATGDSYWTSYESSGGDKAFYYRFGKWLDWSSSNSAKSSARFIRCVRKVTKQ